MRHQRESGRLSGLDGLRALAALGVLTFHADASLLPGGFLGVDLFFVISGYLITRLLLGEVCRTGRIRVAQFYLRRAIRLLPALLVLLVAVVAASALIWRDETATLADTVTASLGYYLNWWLIDARQSYFVASGRPPMLQHLWSLAIEEQFYLLWPAVLLLLNARRRRFGTVAGVAITLALASTAAMAFLAIRQDVPFGADSGRVYFGSDTHAMGLLLGAAMGALAERLAAQPRRSWRFRCWPTDLAGLAALAGLGYVALTVTEFDPRLYRGGFLAVSALAAIAVSTATRPGSLLGRALDCRPLRWLGDRSYAMYLWHWPVAVVTRPGVDLPANRWLVDSVRLAAPIGLAVLSHAFVERPMRVRGTTWLMQRGRPGRSGARRFIPRLAGVTAVAAMLFALAVAPRGGSAPAAVLRSAVLRPAALAARVAESTSPTASASAAASATEVPKTAPAGSKTKQRKPPVPAGPAPRSRGTITAFGDSVMLGAQPALAAAFGRCDLHAVEGQQPSVTLAAIRQLHASGGLAPVVAIHTGNNGLIRPSDLADTLAQLRDRRQVLLLTDRVQRDWEGPNNDTIKRVAKQFGNVVVLDWYADSNGDRGWFFDDGLHLRQPGAQQYASLIARSVER